MKKNQKKMNHQNQVNAAVEKPVNASTVIAHQNVDAEKNVAGLIKTRDKFLKQLMRKGIALHDAEEIFQSSILQAFTHVEQLRETAKLENWFKVILRNQMNDFFRKNSKNQLMEHELEQMMTTISDGLETDLCHCALNLIDLLKPDHAEVLKLRVLENLDVRATANQLGISENLVKVRAHRARDEMKEKLQQCCGIKTLNDAANCDCDE